LARISTKIQEEGKNLRASLCDFVDGSLWRRYANTLARSALRRANVGEETGLHIDRRDHAGSRDWREHGDLQRGLCAAITSAALPGTRAAGDACGKSARRPTVADLVSEFQRLACGGAVYLRHG